MTMRIALGAIAAGIAVLAAIAYRDAAALILLGNALSICG